MVLRAELRVRSCYSPKKRLFLTAASLWNARFEEETSFLTVCRQKLTLMFSEASGFGEQAMMFFAVEVGIGGR